MQPAYTVELVSIFSYIFLQHSNLSTQLRGTSNRQVIQSQQKITHVPNIIGNPLKYKKEVRHSKTKKDILAKTDLQISLRIIKQKSTHSSIVPPAFVCLRASLQSCSCKNMIPAISLRIGLFPMAASANHSFRLEIADS